MMQVRPFRQFSRPASLGVGHFVVRSRMGPPMVGAVINYLGAYVMGGPIGDGRMIYAATASRY